MGSTGPVFAPYWSARLAVGCSKVRTASAWVCTAPEGAPTETLAVHLRVHAILGQNRKSTQRTGRTHVTISSQEGDFVQTSHGPENPKSYEPGHTRRSQACELSIRYFMPRSQEVLGQSAGHVKAKPV